jgi:hypothetical protein
MGAHQLGLFVTGHRSDTATVSNAHLMPSFLPSATVNGMDPVLLNVISLYSLSLLCWL